MWCPNCKSRILTTRQIEEKKPCEQCQKIHAQGLKDRMDIKEEEK